MSAGRYSLISGTQNAEKNPELNTYAMCYGGHQFGNWAGQLGDGRAINLGEIADKHGVFQSVQLKGSGPTPYSRFADGLAVLRSSIREYICSEAMFHLGVPTTRALSLISSGDLVERDMFYDGDVQHEPGAIVSRVAPSFIRFGNFQIFSARGDTETLSAILDYCIQHDFPDLYPLYKKDQKEGLLALFQEVTRRTCGLIVEWMRLGFVHGVMNTDNMSILGLTIDYGPYGWLDSFDPSWTPNTTDAQNRRYRFENQPAVAQWNLLQLANALYPLIQSSEELETIIRNYQPDYQKAWSTMMAKKLGVQDFDDLPSELFTELESLMAETQIDMTRFYRSLSDCMYRYDDESAFDNLVVPNSYLTSIPKSLEITWQSYFAKLQVLVERSENSWANALERRDSMRAVNPNFIPRNYILQQVIDDAHNAGYTALETLQTAIAHPYDEHPSHKAFPLMRPDWALSRAGCSMLSCSS